MKKNSDTRNGRYESPFLPSDGRRIWSRTARMAISPRLWVRPGISLGLRNAAQKNPITMSAARIASSIGLVNPTEPIVNIGFQMKSCKPGAGKPHPLKMWQPPPAAAATAPVTGSSPLGEFPSGGSRADSPRSCPSLCRCLRPRWLCFLVGPDQPGFLVGPDQPGFLVGPDQPGFLVGPDQPACRTAR